MPRALALSALLAAAGPEPARPAPDAARYGWHADYPAGKAEAKRAGKPIMLVFRCEP
jgi:hypothetical protein